MFQVDVFDKFGAILLRFSCRTLVEALEWMFDHRTGNFTDSMGMIKKGATEWQLTRISGREEIVHVEPVKTLTTALGDITDIVEIEPKSKSQMRRLNIQRERGAIGEPWLSGATEEYHEGKAGMK